MDPTTQTPDDQTPAEPTRRQRLTAALPTGLALLLIAGVWVAGAVWSFDEQTAFAGGLQFKAPQLLPLILDGMAIAMAAVAFAASLDARPAVPARLGTLLAIALSAASNVAGAWHRSAGDMLTIAVAGTAPVVAMVAFEVLLAEVRKQVLRRRGQPAPLPVPPPRMIRLVLAPWPTFRDWRRLALQATDPARAFQMDPSGRTPIKATATAGRPAQTRPPVERTPVERTPEQSAIADRPHQTPDPAPVDSQTPADRTPVQPTVRTPVRAAVQTPARAEVRISTRPVQTSLSDEEAMAALRAWWDKNAVMPSLNKIQEIAGCGRSKAIRLRDRLTSSFEHALEHALEP